MGYDSVANNIVMLGGQTFPANAGAGASQTLNDAWTLDSLGWHQDHLVPNPTPGAIAKTRNGAPHHGWQPFANRSGFADLELGWQRLEAPGRPPVANDRLVGLAPLGDQLVLVTENSQVTATQDLDVDGLRIWSLAYPPIPVGRPDR